MKNNIIVSIELIDYRTMYMNIGILNKSLEKSSFDRIKNSDIIIKHDNQVLFVFKRLWRNVINDYIWCSRRKHRSTS